MVKKISYFIFTVLLSVSVFAQTKGDEDNAYDVDDVDYVIPFDSLEHQDKMHFSFDVGAGFGRSNTYGNYFSTYYRPTFTYDVSPRFSVKTGLTYLNSSVENMPIVADYNYQLFSGNIGQYYAFVGGEYKLTERLLVGGSVFYDFTSYEGNNGSSFDGGSNLDNLGYSAYFEYRVSKALSIQGEIRVNDKNPYGMNSSSFSNGFMGTQATLFGR